MDAPDFGRIENELDTLGMTGLSAANFPIGRVAGVSTDVTNLCRDESLLLAEMLFVDMLSQWCQRGAIPK